MLHLDDPQWDVLVAMKDGAPAAIIGVLAMGEVGRIDAVYVAKALRNQGIGRTMMARVLELCARAMFRYVMLSVLPDNTPAQALYRKAGFAPIGQIVAYAAPWTTLATKESGSRQMRKPKS